MLTTQERAAAKNRAGVRRWYDENRDEYNELRRKRYAKNKDARKKAQVRAKNYREDPPTSIEPRKLKRLYKGKLVPVLSTGEVALLCNRAPQTVRNWERQGMIPTSVFEDSHRLYTKRQARMIVTLANAIVRNDGSWDSNEVRLRVEKMKEKW